MRVVEADGVKVNFDVIAEDSEKAQLIGEAISKSISPILKKDIENLRIFISGRRQSKPVGLTGSPSEDYAQQNVETPVLIPLGGEWAFSVSIVQNKYGNRQVRIGKGKIVGGYYRDRKTNQMVLRPDDPLNPISLPNKLNVKSVEDWNRLQVPVMVRLRALNPE